jgi:hypothetical protein
MRLPISYYLLLLYTITTFRPLIPIARNAFEHTFSKAIHLATVHAIYGSNHLQKEIANDVPDNNKQQSNTTGENQLQPHIAANTGLFKYFAYLINIHFFISKFFRLKPGFGSMFTQPPKFS